MSQAYLLFATNVQHLSAASKLVRCTSERAKRKAPRLSTSELSLSSFPSGVSVQMQLAHPSGETSFLDEQLQTHDMKNKTRSDPIPGQGLSQWCRPHVVPPIQGWPACCMCSVTCAGPSAFAAQLPTRCPLQFVLCTCWKCHVWSSLTTNSVNDAAFSLSRVHQKRASCVCPKVKDLKARDCPNGN